MGRRPPRSTRTDTLFPYTTLFRSVRVIGQIRAVRSEMNVPPGARIALIVNEASAASKARLAVHEPLVKTLARVETIAFDRPVPQGWVQDALDACSLVLPLAEVSDLAQDRQHLQKELATLEDRNSTRLHASP